MVADYCKLVQVIIFVAFQMTDLTNPEVMAHRLFQINIAIKSRAAAVAAALAHIYYWLTNIFDCKSFLNNLRKHQTISGF